MSGRLYAAGMDAAGEALLPRRSRRRRRRLLQRLPPTAWAAGTVLALYVLTAFSASLLAPFPPNAVGVGEPFELPDWTHPLGTDALGRDVFSRVLYGGHTALWMASSAAAVTLGAGGLLGLISGYRGGFFDEAMMRLLEIVASIPSIVLALLIIGAFRSNAAVIILTVGLLAAPSSARVIRAATLALVAEDFVLAARARGEGTLAIVWRELLPNVAGTLLVEYSMRLGWAVIFIGGLAFLGFGAPPPTPDWGAMINEGRGTLDASIWPVVAPGGCMAVLVIAVNVLTDGIARALGPAAQGGMSR